MSPAPLKSRIETLGPGTQVEVMDLTGTQDHYQAVIVSPAFAGRLMVEQHRLVFGLLKAEMDSGEVHALTLRTFTPEQYEKFMKG
jgi:stress-induced morphogen